MFMSGRRGRIVKGKDPVFVMLFLVFFRKRNFSLGNLIVYNCLKKNASLSLTEIRNFNRLFNWTASDAEESKME